MTRVSGKPYLISGILTSGLIRKMKGLILFLDFDGTLAPIVAKPHCAELPARTREVLVSLRKAGCDIAIISGRELRDIRVRVGVPRLVYVGNHGCEIQGPGLIFKKKKSVAYHRALSDLKKKLIAEFSSFAGVLIEDKKESLSIHFRLLPARLRGVIEEKLLQVLSPYLRKNIIALQRGKKVYEIRPAIQWNKGTAVRWLLKKVYHRALQEKRTVIYIGDDTTDEDAFQALGRTGVTICVGKKLRSSAQYYLKNTTDVYVFLKRILAGLRDMS